jgi:hypothetical protein
MDYRKKHTICLSESYDNQVYSIDGNRGRLMYYNTSKFLDRSGVKEFARRPFAGAKLLSFRKLKEDFMYGSIFQARTGWGNIQLCIAPARRVLGLGKNTTKFSLWVK